MKNNSFKILSALMSMFLFASCSETDAQKKSTILNAYADNEGVCLFVEQQTYEELRNLLIYEAEFYLEGDRGRLDLSYFGESRKVKLSILHNGEEWIKGAPLIAKRNGNSDAPVFLGEVSLEFPILSDMKGDLVEVLLEAESGEGDSRVIKVNHKAGNK